MRAEPFLQTLRTVAACAIAYGVSTMLRLPEGYWSVITAVVVTHPKLDETLKTSRDQFLGALLGAFAGAGGIELARLGLPNASVFWAILAVLAFISALAPPLRLSCVTLVIVLLIPSSGSPFLRARDRVIEIMVGALASLAVTAVIGRFRPTPTQPRLSAKS